MSNDTDRSPLLLIGWLGQAGDAGLDQELVAFVSRRSALGEGRPVDEIELTAGTRRGEGLGDRAVIGAQRRVASSRAIRPSSAVPNVW